MQIKLMCANDNCSKRQECARALVKPGKNQNWTTFDGHCGGGSVGYPYHVEFVAPAPMTFMERRVAKHALITEHRRLGVRAYNNRH